MASLILSLDTTPPVAASLALLGPDGEIVTLTADQVVEAQLVCEQSPAQLLGEYKLWGDVDLNALGSVQDTEGGSSWATYSDPPLVAVRLSNGTGVKHLYGRLRDDLHNQTPVLAAQVLFDASYPAVRVQTLPDRTRLSQQVGFRSSTFAWVSNVAFVEYAVRVVASPASGALSGSPLSTAAGSIGVAGAGTFPADTPITTTVDAADLVSASPGDGPKTIKVFVRDSAGRWSL
jgi:hypothetical protein